MKPLFLNVSLICPVRMISIKRVAIALFRVLPYAMLKAEMFVPEGAFESAKLFDAWESPSLLGSPVLLYAHLHGVLLFVVFETAV